MSIESIFKRISSTLIGEMPPPKSYASIIVKSPIDEKELTLDVGMVFEHRYAFYYWNQFNRKTLIEPKYSHLRKPILVTIDWHDDVDYFEGYDDKDFALFNFQKDVEVDLFCWGLLGRTNDGNIYPALYLDFFSDVYVLLKQDISLKPKNSGKHEYIYEDINKNKHKVYLYNDSSLLMEKLITKDDYIYLDIDLDYFMVNANSNTSDLIPEKDIRNFLSDKNPLISFIKPRLVGMTIALEPEYCNGIRNSNRILNILNDEFFYGTFLAEDIVCLKR